MGTSGIAAALHLRGAALPQRFRRPSSLKAITPNLLVAALASLALVGCKGGGGDSPLQGGDLAVVNGDAISMAEYYRYLERKPMVQVIATDNIQAGQAAELNTAVPLGFQAMRDLINRRILLQVAGDDKVTPSQADIEKELDFQKKQNPDFMPKLIGQGMNLAEIRRDLTLDLAKEHILTKGITVTPQDVDDFIKKNPEKFMIPAQAKLYVVMVKDDAGRKQVDADLAAGKPFPTVAANNSIDPKARTNQGLFPVSDVSRMGPALQALVNETPAGKTTDWKPDGVNFVKVFVEQKVESKKRTIDDTMKETVRRALSLERGSQANDLPKRLVEKLRTSKIVVNPDSLKKLWETAFKSLQEQDVSANTRTGATAGATTAGAPSVGTAAPGGGAPSGAAPGKP